MKRKRKKVLAAFRQLTLRSSRKGDSNTVPRFWGTSKSWMVEVTKRTLVRAGHMLSFQEAALSELGSWVTVYTHAQLTGCLT